MSRVHVSALTLVNWKGVFYERYSLDCHVTALEGANGAGKTTVMIAAYVALLPDMSRLRFTNVGETGATGGDRGLWGRLGEPGRPAYTLLDLEAGERLVVGVRLRRLAEPSIEPTAFLIEGLPPEQSLADLVLVRSEHEDGVAELDELRDAVKRVGGRLEVFRATKDYFAALFERGIVPLRLAAEEDRHKWNELLRTSMTGGISRVLTSELRGFLLKAEAGLGDVLGRMRANLDACRHTRAEVSEARRLEREISGVHEAGRAMFSAAFHAARLAAEEADAAVSEAQARADQASASAASLAEAATQLAAREAELEVRASEAREQHTARLAQREQARAARVKAQALSGLDLELGELARAAAAAAAQREAAALERGARRAAREHMQDAYRRAASGLLDLQQGQAELHRRAHAHRALGERLAEARELLDMPELELPAVPELLARLSREREGLLAERARLERERDGARARVAERTRALAALAALEHALGAEPDATVRMHELAASAPEAGVSAAVERAAETEPVVDAGALAAVRPVPGAAGRVAVPDPMTRARRVLGRLAEHDRALSDLSDREPLREELERLVQRQRAAQRAAGRVALALGPGAAAELERRTLELEQELERSAGELREHEQALARAREASELARGQQRALAARAQHWPPLMAASRRLSDEFGAQLAEAGALEALRERLAESVLEARGRREQLLADREASLREAQELSGPGAAIDPELIRLRDELGAELLLEYLDAAPPERAAELEAQLGPWTRALVVADPRAAVEAILDRPRTLPEVWLLRAGVDLSRDVVVTGAEDVAMNEAFGMRVSRRPSLPSLGAGARAARAEQLRARAEQSAGDIEALGSLLARLRGLRADLDRVATRMDVWEAGDPTALIEANASELADGEARDAELRAVIAANRQREGEQRAELERLRQLRPEAGLLEPPDHAATLERLATELTRVRARQRAFAPLVAARVELAELIDALRAEPGAPAGADRLVELVATLERLYRAGGALEQVMSQRHASGWGDAAEALDSQAALVPSLEAQHDRAQHALTEADRAVIEADAVWEAATARAQAAEARRGALAAQSERLVSELAALGGEPEPTRLATTETALAAAAEQVAGCEAGMRALVAELARTRERADQASQAVTDARARASAATRSAQPARARWQEEHAEAEAAALLADPVAVGASAAALWAEASSRRALLLDRLARSKGGEDAAEQLRSGTQSARQVWQLVRDWLRQRVPAQVAGSDDPLRSLERLREHLGVLEGRLSRQETDLRGASADVARGIEVQLRRARSQVRRLNAQLQGIEFGSVSGIRIEMRRVERMEQILRALREGDVQELLFTPSLPIEAALDEIFRRYGGGKGGGQRLLDYREYVEPVVEICRKAGSSWEPASPTRLSTGEAIGVGAALMMVVLTEWERDANLLRGGTRAGSLRFLFLDEANRLSRDNLGVLFELCRTLDLQLLVAAPEVARAEGNTTYRLVRHVSEEGREEVVVSGRRVSSSAEPS